MQMRENRGRSPYWKPYPSKRLNGTSLTVFLSLSFLCLISAQVASAQHIKRIGNTLKAVGAVYQISITKVGGNGTCESRGEFDIGVTNITVQPDQTVEPKFIAANSCANATYKLSDPQIQTQGGGPNASDEWNGAFWRVGLESDGNDNDFNDGVFELTASIVLPTPTATATATNTPITVATSTPTRTPTSTPTPSKTPTPVPSATPTSTPCPDNAFDKDEDEDRGLACGRDLCDLDPSKSRPGKCGCGYADAFTATCFDPSRSRPTFCGQAARAVKLKGSKRLMRISWRVRPSFQGKSKYTCEVFQRVVSIKNGTRMADFRRIKIGGASRITREVQNPVFLSGTPPPVDQTDFSVVPPISKAAPTPIPVLFDIRPKEPAGGTSCSTLPPNASAAQRKKCRCNQSNPAAGIWCHDLVSVDKKEDKPYVVQCRMQGVNQEGEFLASRFTSYFTVSLQGFFLGQGASATCPP